MNIDPILYWNDVALEVHRRDFAFAPAVDGKSQDPQQKGPTATSRALAIVHIAMYDAWNGASGTGNQYLGTGPRPPLPGVTAGASPDSAVASAALTTLKSLYSRQAAFVEARMADFCAALPIAATPAQRQSGLEFGHAVADALLGWRSGDNANLPEDFVAGDLPGSHRPDPLNPVQGFLHPRWGEVTPFCIAPFPPNGSTAAYLAPPPAFASNAYKQHFAEVRDHGARARGKRSAAQEMTGLYWAYDGAKSLGTPPRLYNQIVRVVARDRGNTVTQNARLFALINAGMADAGIVAWRAKYEHNFWRPCIGVREDDAGTGPSGLGTGATVNGDPAWVAYGAPRSNEPGRGSFTPPFPAYPSGHASFGTTVFEIVAAFYGVATTALQFDFVSDELNGQTVGDDGSLRTCVRRTYTLAKAIEDNLESRVWLGVHWRFDGEGGRELGQKVAAQVIAGCFP